MIALLVACNPGSDSGNPEHPDVNTTADDMSFLGSTEKEQLQSVEGLSSGFFAALVSKAMDFGGAETDYFEPGSYVSQPEGVWKLEISEIVDDRQTVTAVITGARVQSGTDIDVFYNIWGDAEFALTPDVVDFVFDGVVEDGNGNVFSFTADNPLDDNAAKFTVNGNELVGQY